MLFNNRKLWTMLCCLTLASASPLLAVSQDHHNEPAAVARSEPDVSSSSRLLSRADTKTYVYETDKDYKSEGKKVWALVIEAVDWKSTFFAPADANKKLLPYTRVELADKKVKTIRKEFEQYLKLVDKKLVRNMGSSARAILFKGKRPFTRYVINISPVTKSKNAEDMKEKLIAFLKMKNGYGLEPISARMENAPAVQEKEADTDAPSDEDEE